MNSNVGDDYASDSLPIDWSSHECEESSTCAHIEVFRSNHGVKIKISNILPRCEHFIIDNGNRNNRVSLQVPPCEDDEYGNGSCTSLLLLVALEPRHRLSPLIVGKNALSKS